MSYSTILFSLTALLTFSFDPTYTESSKEFVLGKASYYSHRFEGRKTAFGEVFSNKHFTAAHRTFAHNTMLEVTNLKNGKNIIVRVNDRGPWVKRHLIDLSRAAAEELGIVKVGIADVSVKVVGKDGKLFNEGLTSSQQLIQNLLVKE